MEHISGPIERVVVDVAARLIAERPADAEKIKAVLARAGYAVDNGDAVRIMTDGS